MSAAISETLSSVTNLFNNERQALEAASFKTCIFYVFYLRERAEKSGLIGGEGLRFNSRKIFNELGNPPHFKAVLRGVKFDRPTILKALRECAKLGLIERVGNLKDNINLCFKLLMKKVKDAPPMLADCVEKTAAPCVETPAAPAIEPKPAAIFHDLPEKIDPSDADQLRKFRIFLCRHRIYARICDLQAAEYRALYELDADFIVACAEKLAKTNATGSFNMRYFFKAVQYELKGNKKDGSPPFGDKKAMTPKGAPANQYEQDATVWQACGLVVDDLPEIIKPENDADLEQLRLYLKQFRIYARVCDLKNEAYKSLYDLEVAFVAACAEKLAKTNDNQSFNLLYFYNFIQLEIKRKRTAARANKEKNAMERFAVKSKYIELPAAPVLNDQKDLKEFLNHVDQWGAEANIYLKDFLNRRNFIAQVLKHYGVSAELWRRYCLDYLPYYEVESYSLFYSRFLRGDFEPRSEQIEQTPRRPTAFDRFDETHKIKQRMRKILDFFKDNDEKKQVKIRFEMMRLIIAKHFQALLKFVEELEGHAAAGTLAGYDFE